uniref:Uncharacterized protein n=1 Tax=Romanomermis culicivorax TaxID=13658 RepID=A0A915KGE9_ROMCU
MKNSILKIRILTSDKNSQIQIVRFDNECSGRLSTVVLFDCFTGVCNAGFVLSGVNGIFVQCNCPRLKDRLQKAIVKGCVLILSTKRSRLFKNSSIGVERNHFELQIVSKSFTDSCNRFYFKRVEEFYIPKTTRTKTIITSLKAATYITAFTLSKQCIHFRRSDLWPPTSKTLKMCAFCKKREHNNMFTQRGYEYSGLDAVPASNRL